MEILYAYMHQKKIVLINVTDKFPSPWLIYHCTKIVNTVHEALEFLLALPIKENNL